jgi:putative endonuclease
MKPFLKWFQRAKPRSLGEQGEDLAAGHLKHQGYHILARNIWLGRYEIDILAQKGDTVAFVEVRSLRQEEPIAPEDTVGPVKQKHLQTAARHYMTTHHNIEAYYRFDVIAVVFPKNGKPRLKHYEDAFPGE